MCLKDDGDYDYCHHLFSWIEIVVDRCDIPDVFETSETHKHGTCLWDTSVSQTCSTSQTHKHGTCETDVSQRQVPCLWVWDVVHVFMYHIPDVFETSHVDTSVSKTCTTSISVCHHQSYLTWSMSLRHICLHEMSQRHLGCDTWRHVPHLRLTCLWDTSVSHLPCLWVSDVAHVFETISLRLIRDIQSLSVWDWYATDTRHTITLAVWDWYVSVWDWYATYNHSCITWDW